MVEYDIVPRGTVPNGRNGTPSKWRKLFQQLAEGDNEAIIRGTGDVLRATRRRILVSFCRLRAGKPRIGFRISTRLAHQDGEEVLVVRREEV